MNLRSCLFLLLSAIVTMALYFPGLSGPFLFDDTHTIEHNQWIHIDDLEFETLKYAAESFVARGRELAMLSFAVNYYFSGLDTYAFKAVNLAIHIGNGVLLYILTTIIVSLLVPRKEAGGNFLFRWTPEIVVGLWLISPINLTSVLYVSQRMATLAALFSLLGLLVYILARRRHLQRGKFPWIAIPVLLTCLWAAYLSKENGLLLIPFLVLLEWLLFGFRTPSGRTNRSAVLLTIAAVILGFLVAAQHFGLHLDRIASWYDNRPFSLEERLLTQGRVLILYIGLILFPLVGRFSLWHDDFSISTSLTNPIDTATSIVLLLLILVTVILTRKRNPLCTLGVLWFFVSHSMESTIIPLEMVHEHRNYLASFGVILALVGFLGYLTSARTFLKLALLGALGMLAATTLHARSSAWGSEYSLAYHEFINHPTSARAAFQLARINLLYAQRGFEPGKEAALQLFEYGNTLGDETILPEVAMIISMRTLGTEFDPGWIDSAIRKLEVHGGAASNVMALRGLTDCVSEGNCRVDHEQLIRLYSAAVDTGRTTMMDEAARFFNVIGENDLMIETMTLAAEKPGASVQVRINYARMLIALGYEDRARAHLVELGLSEQKMLARQRQAIEDLRKEVEKSSGG